MDGGDGWTGSITILTKKKPQSGAMPVLGFHLINIWHLLLFVLLGALSHHVRSSAASESRSPETTQREKENLLC